MEARHKKAEEENERLRQEVEELQVGFAAQTKELEGEYKKQVDDMLFFSYCCCMKKHGIIQDTPNYPLDDEGEVVGGPDQGDGDAAKASSFGG
ncbi:hypothetical protein PVL29_002529 [Vitis rotundifolia]|uniref:Uncharacterized protein n=1 Tax=Vitis rotundifolia TaxID=103349 RepID=A0AA39AJE5_VITRO|nr:hypothetical protein PVL29_002529 [Vitis rotundifolia]